MYLGRDLTGTKHLWSDNPESDIALYTVVRMRIGLHKAEGPTVR